MTVILWGSRGRQELVWQEKNDSQVKYFGSELLEKYAQKIVLNLQETDIKQGI